MNEMLATFGISMLLAWTSLPVFAALASNRKSHPSSRHQALLLALAVSAALLWVPWVRMWTHRVTALCFSDETIARASGLTPASFVAETGRPSLYAMVGGVALVAIAFGLVRIAISARRLSRLLRSASPASSRITTRSRALATKMGLSAPDVVVHDDASVPFVAGWRRVVLVIPSSLVRSLDEHALDLVLEHELVHVARKDTIAAIAVACLRIPFTFHPTARWLAKEITVAREQAVDEIVGREDPCGYARLLVDVAENASFGGFAAPVAMEVTSLERRIRRLGEKSGASPSRCLRVTLCGFAMFTLSMLAPLRAETTTHLLTCHDEIEMPVPANGELDEECTPTTESCLEGELLPEQCEEL